MRTFRNAALAAATASAVVLGGTSVAAAQENPTGGSSTFTSGSSKYKEVNPDKSLGDFSSAVFQGPGLFKAGQLVQSDQTANLTDVFGTKVDDTKNPVWAMMWRDALNWVGLAAGIGLIIAAANAALHEGLLPQIPW